MLNKLKRKEGINIRICTEADRNMLNEFLNEKPVFHTFLLSDIEQYGFDKPFQTVYVQEQAGKCQGVFMKYFQNLILAGIENALDYQKIATLVSDEITTIMGNAEIVRCVVKHMSKNSNMIYNNLYIHQTQKQQAVPFTIQYATLEDVDRIYTFLMSFPEIKNLYAQKDMLINRLEQEEGIHVFIEKDGQIIAHGNSAAAAENTCMMGGICVAKAYRGKGYAKAILQTLCNHIHKQNKIPCIFAPEEKAYSIFTELGFEVYGRWGVAHITK